MLIRQNAVFFRQPTAIFQQGVAVYSVSITDSNIILHYAILQDDILPTQSGAIAVQFWLGIGAGKSEGQNSRSIKGLNQHGIRQRIRRNNWSSASAQVPFIFQDQSIQGNINRRGISGLALQI